MTVLYRWTWKSGAKRRRGKIRTKYGAYGAAVEITRKIYGKERITTGPLHLCIGTRDAAPNNVWFLTGYGDHLHLIRVPHLRLVRPKS